MSYGYVILLKTVPCTIFSCFSHVSQFLPSDVHCGSMRSQGHRQSSECSSQHLQKLNQPHGSWQRSIPPPAPRCGRKCSASCFPFLPLPFISFPFYFLVSHRRADSAPLLLNQLAIFFCPAALSLFLSSASCCSFFALQNSPSNCQAGASLEFGKMGKMSLACRD